VKRPKKWPKESQRRLLAQGGVRSFRFFVKYVLGIPQFVRGNPMGKWWDEGVHGPWCDWLQRQVEEWEKEQERRFIMIDAHRGAAKSMLCTKALPLWLLLRDPNRACVISSAVTKFSIEFGEYIRKVLADQDGFAIFAWLYGNWESDTWTMDRFTVSPRRVNRTEGSVEITAVETGITGKHPEVMILDDPVTKEKIVEEGNWISKAKKHMDSVYPALLNHSLFVYVGTPYTDGDPLTSAIRRDGVCEVEGMPLPTDYARYLRKSGLWHMYHLPGRKEDGTPTLPNAWPEKDLSRYQDTNPSDYAAQIMLCPGSGDLQPLTYTQIEECLINSAEVPPNTIISIHMDTAFKNPKRTGTGDFSTIIVAAHHRALADVYYIAEHGSNSWRDDDFISRLIEVVRHLYERKKIIFCMTDEAEIGGKTGLWRDRLRSAFRDASLRMPHFEELRRGRGENNTARISSVAGYWMDGHVKLVRGRCPNLIDQMARIGLSEHDDYASAAADAFHPNVYRIFNPQGTREAPVERRPFEEILSGTSIRASYDHWHRRPKAAFGPRSPIR